MPSCIALISVSLALHIVAAFLILAALVGALVWFESRRPDTDQEIAQELSEFEDAWAGFVSAKENNPVLSEMEVRS